MRSTALRAGGQPEAGFIFLVEHQGAEPQASGAKRSAAEGVAPSRRQAKRSRRRGAEPQASGAIVAFLVTNLLPPPVQRSGAGGEEGQRSGDERSDASRVTCDLPPPGLGAEEEVIGRLPQAAHNPYLVANVRLPCRRPAGSPASGAGLQAVAVWGPTQLGQAKVCGPNVLGSCTAFGLGPGGLGRTGFVGRDSFTTISPASEATQLRWVPSLRGSGQSHISTAAAAAS